ncbi:ATP-NAD kinase-like domain-containing protein [Ochromonadaceae sp. CCMP2298]|nr:ATP-NAD kinase-like domain-containing protein [Ochromonadaceae sp. CCMP2298]
MFFALHFFSFLILYLMATTVAQNPMVDGDASAAKETCNELLSALDGNVYFRGKPCFLVLTETALHLYSSKEMTKAVMMIRTADLVGSTVEEGKEKLMSTVKIVYYPPQHGFFVNEKDGIVRARRSVNLRFGDSVAAAQGWVYAVRTVVAGVPLRFEDGLVQAPPVRSFLVVVNPVGGQKQGMAIWKKVAPMLEAAGVAVTLVVTEYADHAKKVAAELDATSVSAILCIGGDGIVFEVVNGLISRADGKEVLASLPIAHVPGGTGNGLAKSVLFASKEACTPQNAVFVALRGHPSSLDLSRYTTQSGSHISFLSFAWGLVADVDILSESMRYLGEARLHVAAVYFLMKKKYYRGVLRLNIAENDSENCDNNELIAASSADSAGLLGDGSQAEAVKDGIEPEGGWVTIEGKFLMVWAVQTSHAATSIYSGPGVGLDDGLFTVYVVQSMARLGILQLLLEMDAGGHVKHPKVKVYKCSAFSLEPITENGIYSLDGEVVEYGPIKAETLPSAARVMSL